MSENLDDLESIVANLNDIDNAERAIRESFSQRHREVLSEVAHEATLQVKLHNLSDYEILLLKSGSHIVTINDKKLFSTRDYIGGESLRLLGFEHVSSGYAQKNGRIYAVLCDYNMRNVSTFNGETKMLYPVKLLIPFESLFDWVDLQWNKVVFSGLLSVFDDGLAQVIHLQKEQESEILALSKKKSPSNLYVKEEW